MIMKSRYAQVVAVAAVAAAVLTLPGTTMAATSGATCRVLQPCAHHGTTYRVNSVKLTRTIGSGYFQERTSGVFVVLNVTMTNTKSKSSTIMAANLALQARNGDQYDTSSKVLGLKNALLLLQELQPKLPQTVLLVYEVPRGAARGSKLVITDMRTGDKARINLGL